MSACRPGGTRVPANDTCSGIVSEWENSEKQERNHIAQLLVNERIELSKRVLELGG